VLFNFTLENWAQVFYIINSVTSKSPQNKFKRWRVRELNLGQLLVPNFWTFWNKEDSCKCFGKFSFKFNIFFNCQNSRKNLINFNKSSHFYTCIIVYQRVKLLTQFVWSNSFAGRVEGH
jgi:hypothetical protein